MNGWILIAAEELILLQCRGFRRPGPSIAPWGKSSYGNVYKNAKKGLDKISRVIVL